MLFLFVVRSIFFLTCMVSLTQATPLTNVRGTSVINVNRQTYTNEITEKIRKNGYVFLVGFAGMGKSRIARQFALDCQKQDASPYEIIWWIDGKKDILDQLNLMVRELHTQTDGSIPSSSIFNEILLLKQIEAYAKLKNLKVLIIFDSLEDIKDVKNLFENTCTENLHLLLTSRKNIGYSSFIKVAPFSSKQSQNYLKEILPNVLESDLVELAETLNHYPLALSQSSHYLQQHQATSIQDYLKLYQRAVALTPA